MKEKYERLWADRRIRKAVQAGAVAASCLVLASGAMNGTFAWFTAKSEEVVNTFTIGDINISLKETGAVWNEESGTYDKAYFFVPGRTLEKDPYVTVTQGSEKCYLFIHVKEENNTQTGLEEPVIAWEVDTQRWKPVVIQEEGEQAKTIEGYWYCVVDVSDQGKELHILKNDKVVVNDEVTKEMVAAINAKKPTLTFLAAAIQYEGMHTAAEAWSSLPDYFKP